MMESLEWRSEALCVGFGDVFFPDTKEEASVARKICASCPVRMQCLEYAVENHIDHGVWGGLTRLERHELARGSRVRSEPLVSDSFKQERVRRLTDVGWSASRIATHVGLSERQVVRIRAKRSQVEKLERGKAS